MAKFSYLHIITIYLVLSLLFLPAIFKVSSTFNENVDSSLMQQAEEAVSSAYEMVLNAENAGANVTNPLMKLNEAASYLSTAKNLLRNEDPDGVAELILSSIEIAVSAKNEANSLKASALADRDFGNKLSILISSVVVSIFLVFMFYLWQVFKRSYMRKFLDLTLEVVSVVES
jgi:predicted PurR-regulated permease PerM